MKHYNLAMNKTIILYLALLSNSVYAQNNKGIEVHIVRDAITINFDKLETQIDPLNKTKILIFEKYDSIRMTSGAILNSINLREIKFDPKYFQIDLYYFHQDSGVQICKLEKEISFKINGIKGDILHKLPVLYIYGNQDSIIKYKSKFAFNPVKLKPGFFSLTNIDEINIFLGTIQKQEPPDLRPALSALAEKILNLEKLALTKNKDTAKYKIWSLNFFQSLSSKAILNTPASINCNISGFNTIELTKTNFSLGKRRNIGIINGISYKSFSVTSNSNNITDYLGNNYYDPTGETYQKVMYGNGLKDIVYFNQIGLKLGLKFKSKQLKHSKSYFSISPSIDLNSLISSNFIAQEGYVSIGGIYPQFNPNDTMFNNLYGFSQNNPVDKTKRNFNGKSTSITYNLDLNFAFAPFSKYHIKNFYFQIGIRTSYSSNLINAYSSNSTISEDLNNYNPLLNRVNSFKYLNIGIYCGIAYKL
jgi:hypothetical protein